MAEKETKETTKAGDGACHRVFRKHGKPGRKKPDRCQRRFNASDADIKTALVEDYGISEQEALSYLK